MAETNPNEGQTQQVQAQSQRAADAARKEAERRSASKEGDKPAGGNLRDPDFEVEVPMTQGPMGVVKETPPSDAELFAEDDEEAVETEGTRPRAAALEMKPRRGRPKAGAGSGEAAPGVQIDPVALGLAIAAANETIRVRSESLVATEGLDETAPGGCYVVDGKVVDAFNNEIKADKIDKSTLRKEHVAIHEHAQKVASAHRRRLEEGRR